MIEGEIEDSRLQYFAQILHNRSGRFIIDVAGKHQMATTWSGILEIMELVPSEGLMMGRAQPERSAFDECSPYETRWKSPDSGAIFEDVYNDFFA
jgi:hypothetical protein